MRRTYYLSNPSPGVRHVSKHFVNGVISKDEAAGFGVKCGAAWSGNHAFGCPCIFLDANPWQFILA